MVCSVASTVAQDRNKDVQIMVNHYLENQISSPVERIIWFEFNQFFRGTEYIFVKDFKNLKRTVHSKNEKTYV